MRMADMKRRCITVEPACLHERELSECEQDKEIQIDGNWRKCTLTSYKDRQFLRRISNLAVIITCALIGGNIVFFGYVSYRVDFFDNVIAPYTRADSLADFLKGVYLLVKVFLSGSWLGICGLEILITLLLGKELRIYIEHLQNRINSKNYDLEDLRQQYTSLCDLIEKANDMFKLYNGSTWVTSIAHILLLLYSLIWFPDTRHNTLVFLAHIFWMVAVTVMLLAIAISCTIVSNLAHKPTHILYVLPLRNVSTEYSLQYSTFLKQLTDPVGISVMNLFIIDKTTFLTLSGMLATYFVVLLQFKQSLEPATSSNSTLLTTA